ncbi:MAG TPA: hypothetical protein VFW33_01920, partial [Gemmataceae bacterium]|nr:hypothetical protein [Gemmataceae bacterium]
RPDKSGHYERGEPIETEVEVKRSPWTVVIGTALLLAAPARPCSLCMMQLQSATYRQDATQSKLILFGAVTESRLLPGDGPAGAGKGISTFQIKTVLKSDPWLGKKTAVEIPRYVPVSDPKDPPKYVLFCDVFKDKLDVFRGAPVKSEAAAEYLKGLLAADGEGSAAVLRHCFNYLEHADRELAADAYLEFAKATDRDIAAVAPKLSAEKLRGWLKSADTPAERLGMYAFLLGGCGGDADAKLLRALIDHPTERTTAAFDGLLGGYIQLRPREGWDAALTILKDEKRPFALRFAAVRTLRFYHTWKPEETRERVMQGMAAVLGQSDAADIAVEDLRRWKAWDLTADVLALYGKKGYDAPLMQRALVRYALTCPRDEAKKFADDLRRRDPELYRDVAEALQFEKK